MVVNLHVKYIQVDNHSNNKHQHQVNQIHLIQVDAIVVSEKRLVFYNKLKILINFCTNIQNRIVGGVNTGVNEFPMMAALVDARSKTIFCGATIIDKNYVLTSAHCIYGRDISTYGVLVGDHDTSTGKQNNIPSIIIKMYDSLQDILILSINFIRK